MLLSGGVCCRTQALLATLTISMFLLAARTPPVPAQYVRDHLNATIYLRTAGTPRWYRLSLPDALRAAEAAGGGPRFTHIEQLAPPDEPWALDRSAEAGGGAATAL